MHISLSGDGVDREAEAIRAAVEIELVRRTLNKYFPRLSQRWQPMLRSAEHRVSKSREGGAPSGVISFDEFDQFAKSVGFDKGEIRYKVRKIEFRVDVKPVPDGAVIRYMQAGDWHKYQYFRDRVTSLSKPQWKPFPDANAFVGGQIFYWSKWPTHSKIYTVHITTSGTLTLHQNGQRTFARREE